MWQVFQGELTPHSASENPCWGEALEEGAYIKAYKPVPDGACTWSLCLQGPAHLSDNRAEPRCLWALTPAPRPCYGPSQLPWAQQVYWGWGWGDRKATGMEVRLKESWPSLFSFSHLTFKPMRFSFVLYSRIQKRKTHKRERVELNPWRWQMNSLTSRWSVVLLEEVPMLTAQVS